MGGGGSSTPSYTWSEVRFAPYIESQHQTFLATVASNRNIAIADNPFTGYTDIEVDDAFFGTGYTISSFPSLYDMYGKFMAGLDVDALYTQTYNDCVNGAAVNSLISAEAALMDDDIDTNAIPRLQTGMRDINAVMGSSYVVGRAIIEDARVKALAKYDAQLRYNMIPVASSRWSAHLDWNKQVIAVYAEVMKFYYSAKTDINEQNYSFAAKETLWPFTVLDFERAALGALQGATNSKQDVAGASTASKVLSGALSGAAMGAMIGSQIGGTTTTTTAGVATTTASTYGGLTGGAWGAGVGAVLGIGAALTY
jgi:hypothetical protein